MQKNQQNNVLVTKEIVREKTEKRKLLNQYMKIKKIGQGNFSKIKLMTDIKTGKQFAMKKYNMFILKKKVRMGAKIGGQVKYSSQADQVYNQISIMKKLNHPNVVKLHEILQDDEQEKIYLIMDYCKYGDVASWDHKIQKFVTKWSLKHIAKFFKEAAQGLEYLHELNIVHRDVKPQNILICEDQTAKLIDFGRSVQLSNSEQKLTGSEGTYHFMAPQTLSQKIVGGYNGKLCDIWSLGISLFGCIFGYLPFNDQLLIKTFDKIEKGQYKLPTQLSPGQQKFIPLIKQILNIDWLKRPTLKEVYTKLKQIEESL